MSRNPVIAAACGLVLAAYAAEVECLEVRSAAMGKSVPVAVILPDGYRTMAERRFPVAYALHGANGDPVNFFQARPGGLLPQLADRYGFIAVCPDGGRTGWWIDSPVNAAMRYETLVVKEVLPFVDGRYRTQPDRRNRAVFGVSMGGHGACYIGFRHTGLFGVVCSVMGGLDLVPYASRFDGRWGLEAVLGPIKENPARWRDFSAVTQARNLKNGDVELLVICGTDDFFLGTNRQMHDLLSANAVRHAYVELRGADEERSMHTAAFANEALPLVARFIGSYFDTGIASP